MEFWGMVTLITLSSSTSTISGWAEVTKMIAGRVDIGLSLSRIPGRSAYSVVSLSRCSWMPLTRGETALSCRQVYLPCCKSSWDLFSASSVLGWVGWEGCQCQLSRERTIVQLESPAGSSSTPGWNLLVLWLPGSCFGQLVHSVSCLVIRLLLLWVPFCNGCSMICWKWLRSKISFE